jgi:hypothetical protein
MGVKNLLGILGMGSFNKPGFTAAARIRGEGLFYRGAAKIVPDTFFPFF